MKVANSKEIQAIDSIANKEIGISGVVLMENAGQAVVSRILQKYPDIYSKRVTVVSGKGNNGGDGLVIARHLFNRGICVEVFVLAERKFLSHDAGINFDIAKKIGLRINEIAAITDIGYISKVLKVSDIIVDAILGTGLSKEVSGLYKEAIKLINQAQNDIISVDIPSGISADTGDILGDHIDAKTTVSLVMPKVGNVVYPAAEFSGDIEVVDIGIPKKVVSEQKIKIQLTEKKDVRLSLKKRSPIAHKGTYGHTLILAGSYGKGGAAGMAALSALRVGSGLITLAIPEKINAAMEMGIPEVMTLPLDQTEGGSLDITSKKEIIKQLKGKSVILIGPGLSTYPSTVKLVHTLLMEEINCPVVLDADGINSFAGRIEMLKDKPFPLIITPHPGEMARLLDITPDEVQADRLNIAGSFAKKHKLYVVLKGAGTITATPKGNIFINNTGNPGMATAGSGDVLAGMTAGFLSQGNKVDDAIKSAVFLHGLAGDIAVDRVGEYGLIAGDIIKNIPYAIKEVKYPKHPALSEVSKASCFE